MTHASRELIEAMAGVAPHSSRAEFNAREERECANACGQIRIKEPYRARPVPVMACQGYAAASACTDGEDPDEFFRIDCPRCLVAIDAALEGRVLEVAA